MATGVDGRCHTGRIVPVYERTGSVTTNMQRRLVWEALEQLPPRAVRSGAARHPHARGLARRGARRCAARTFRTPDTPIDALNLFRRRRSAV